MNEYLTAAFLSSYILPWAIKIALAIAIFVVGKWVAWRISLLAERLLLTANLDQTLARFLRNIGYWALLAAVVIAALDQLGVNTTSLLAVIGAAGLAIGLALKDSLGNFASGVMLILFRPFDLGDYVEAGGTAGTVEEIGLFATKFMTPDNRLIIVPNSQVAGGTIVNVNAKGTRRLDLVIGIGYADDIDVARKILVDLIANDQRILAEPAPAVTMAELADSSVNFNVRPWVNSADYWAVRADLLEAIKKSFDTHGVSIPFPQQDVHLHQAA